MRRLIAALVIILLATPLLIVTRPAGPASAQTGARPTLQLGSRGPAVIELQQLLNAWMVRNTSVVLPLLVVDGVFGRATQEAVRQFQIFNGLVVDCIVGPRTWAALLGQTPAATPVPAAPAPTVAAPAPVVAVPTTAPPTPIPLPPAPTLVPPAPTLVLPPLPTPTAVPAAPTAQLPPAQGQPQPLQILKQGLSQEGTEVSYAALVFNPNPALIARSTQYQVAAYDANGAVLGTDSHFITVLYPRETLGIAGRFFVPPGSQAVSIGVQVTPTDFAASTGLTANPFFAQQAAFFAGRTPRVTGIITSTLNTPVSKLRVVAVVYDAAGTIIGGGFTYLDVVPANGQVPVSVYVSVSGTPSRAELYPAGSEQD